MHKFVVFENYERVFRRVTLAVTEVGVLDVYSASCCANIFAERVFNKYDCALVASNIERSNSL